MNTKPIQPKRALISVSNKHGIIDFAKQLNKNGIEIISTGGTARALRKSGIPVIDISSFTGFPEMMDGRVKTLHPKVHAGILGLRDAHAKPAKENNIQWIDLVICNLYPFAEIIQKENVSIDEIIEHIDIGGPTLIRSAAKNAGFAAVVIDPNDYNLILDEIKAGGISYETRKRLQAKAFSHTSRYDSIISGYLSRQNDLLEKNKAEFTEEKNFSFIKHADLRYGENPHQKAAVYKNVDCTEKNILNAVIHQGKQLSYNNILDADSALQTLKEFNKPACVVVKHTNPCGSAIGQDITEAFKRAYNADALSAFGGIIALNKTCTEGIAKEIIKIFAEIVIAPKYENRALALFKQKANLRVLEFGEIPRQTPKQTFAYIDGGILLQDYDAHKLSKENLAVVTKKEPSLTMLDDMLFAWRVAKHVKSNAIVIAKDGATAGIGAGQMSRIDSVYIAVKKAGDKINGAVLASDAFFPFRDSIDILSKTGIKAIIQPGGSIKDNEVISACNEHGIMMVFTGIRCFRH